MIKRIFVQLPLLIITFVLSCTMVVPLFYWIFTGEDPSDKIVEVWDEILSI